MIPSNITIGTIDYTVHIVEPYSPHLVQGAEVYWARINYVEGTIYISNDLKGDALIQSFLHEVIHGCTKFYLKRDEDLTEEQIDVVATSLIPLYKQLIETEKPNAKTQ